MSTATPASKSVDSALTKFIVASIALLAVGAVLGIVSQSVLTAGSGAYVATQGVAVLMVIVGFSATMGGFAGKVLTA